ncbi:hydantoinase B/oxoprolinase family protein [Marinimicrococcus flavescens]|uniref:Hydantoinase B/oxoprolinase family protein n=1 Tax=Marinimicrococcus flavescens TaxID=3031815 RepID=A0AAP3XSV4_9PROT|nr:hydantoinase B/oxoprolinase family protein [Marinimicrococcus flavescens]
MSLSPIDLQIMWNRLVAVVEEQAQALLRTAFSPIVRECGDLSAGVFDRHGRMLAQAVTGTPGHVNSMAESVKYFIEAFPLETMKEGDAYITNDPWKGTGHLNDFVVTTPAFHNGELVGLFSCTSHLTDIGGIGFGPDGTDVHMEGIYLPFLKIVDQGRVNRDIVAICKANTRLPVEVEGDIYSLVGCNDVGARRLSAMMGEFGLANLDELAEHILGQSRKAVLAELAKLPKGSFDYAMTIDGYDEPLELVARTTIGEDGVTVDFDGTSPMVRRGINVPLSYTTAYSCFGLMCAIAPGVPNNAGSLGVFEVTAPEGALLNAPYPAAVSSRHVIGQMLPDVVFGCLRQAIPERCPAEGTSCLWNMTFRGPSGRGNNGQYGFAFTMTSNGGTGARPSRDGLSATAYPSGVKGTPVEIVEAQTPLVFWRKEYREGSGGAGRFRGGHGQAIEVEHGEGLPFELLAAMDRIQFPPRGVLGGKNGAAGALTTSSGRTLRGKGFQIVEGGERLTVLTPGGGGYGDPAERDPALAASDAENGLSAG